MVSGLNKDSFMKWFLAFWLVLTSCFSVSLYANDAVLQQAYQSQQSDLQVQGFGQLVKVLPDDNDGSRHQKFILKLNSGQTLLVVHISEHSDQSFRDYPITHFGLNRSLIPRLSDHF